MAMTLKPTRSAVSEGKPFPGYGVILIGVIVLVTALSRPLSDGEIPADPLSPEGLQDAQPLSSGQDLYGRHCAQCHGVKGDGQGPAARFLYPTPRDFSEGKFRIVSTANSKPSDQDLLRVITNGMPGSMMIPFGHLSERDRTELVGHVRKLMLAGYVDRQKRKLEEEGEDANLAQLTATAEKALAPGELSPVPAAPTASRESAARGEKHYQVLCAGCHGKTGRGDGEQVQRNDDGMPTRPRDLTKGYFKGGRERDQLYARIMLGLPGSPMPSSANALKPNDAHDVIDYVLSLSDAAAQAKVEHKRTAIAVKRAKEALPATAIAEGVWAVAETKSIVISPLWWREFADPDLKVSALHDGTTLAIRLTWHDTTANGAVLRPEDFEDMAAVQFFKGKDEPFLGMGSETGPVEMWQWRAGADRRAAFANSKLDDYPFDAEQYKHLLKDKSQTPPDQITARAAGNPLTAGGAAGSLAAKGFGSTTMRPKASQKVSVESHWKDGRWTVTLRRPLAVAAEDGMTFAAGDKCSIAFAVWDGAVRDRNGQKLVSIWHDFTLE